MYWNKIIDYWCESQERFGLTIPYLVGVERIFAGRTDFNNKDLLSEINDSKFDKKYIISFCGDLAEYVIGLDRPEYPYIKSLPHFDSLVVNDPDLEKKNLDELSDYLDELYHYKIDEELFSIDYCSLEWSKFNLDEIKEITEIINY